MNLTTSRTISLRNLVLSAMMLALAYVLPFFTGNIPQIGSMLLPMHLPVLLCGFLCGGPWGAVVGLIAPLMRSAILGMPPPFPTAVAMAFELATYGFLSSFLFSKLPKKNLTSIYVSLLSAMVGGRLVWGVVTALLLAFGTSPFTLQAFWVGAVTSAIPGIILQLVAIPAIVLSLQKSNLITL